jgi:CheY-like chemotaxis protein
MAIRVLVAEDREAQRLSMKLSLQMRGFDVLAASNGAEAWRLFQEHDFDVVVTDREMPEMDGMELIGLIKQADQKFPIILYCAAHGDLQVPQGVTFFSKADMSVTLDVIASKLRELAAK